MRVAAKPFSTNSANADASNSWGRASLRRWRVEAVASAFEMAAALGLLATAAGEVEMGCMQILTDGSVM